MFVGKERESCALLPRNGRLCGVLGHVAAVCIFKSAELQEASRALGSQDCKGQLDDEVQIVLINAFMQPHTQICWHRICGCSGNADFLLHFGAFVFFLIFFL